MVGLKKERGFLNFVVVVRKKEKQKKKNSHTALCVVCCVYMCVCVCVPFNPKKKKRSRAPLYKNSICLASLFFIVLMLCETFYVVYLFFLVLVV